MTLRLVADGGYDASMRRADVIAQISAQREELTAASVERGVADGEAGRVIPHTHFAADMRRKWLHGSAQ